MKAYIYGIKNVINNKIYIGSTKSLKTRKYTHFYQLKKQTHGNEHLQKSYDKYGKDKFYFYVIEECNISNRHEREIYWINHLSSHLLDYGYNIYEPDCNKFKCSETTKQKIIEANIKIGRSIKVDAYTTDLLFIGTFNSISECSRATKIYEHVILEIIKGKRLTYKGHTFFKHGEIPYKRISPKQRVQYIK